MNLEALGIPKAKVNQFIKKGIETVEDLTQFFPRKYYDFRKITPINMAIDSEIIAVYGKVLEVKSNSKEVKEGKSKVLTVRAKITDESKRFMSIVWFHSAFIESVLKVGESYIFCGKIQFNQAYGNLQMMSPLYFGRKEDYQKIIPVYSKIKGMSDDYLLKTIDTALAVADKKEYLEPPVMQKFNLIKLSQALRGIHQPDSGKGYKESKKRLVFDDLFTFAMQLEEASSTATKESPFHMKKANIVKPFMDTLPFKLTEGQHDTLRKIYIQMRDGKRVSSLVQGDVGCGKTIVAIILMLIAYENGYQSVMMAPTNVLAKQHYEDLVEKLTPLGVKVVFLSGDKKAMTAKERREALKAIASGETHMIVGTHAVISKGVEFNNLALTIVDEEHRFGVAQRNLLRDKAKHGVHSVTMSATPIPRTLALSIYGGGVDVHTIRTLPTGRKPVKTTLVTDDKEAYTFMQSQIKEGRQCYIVCPLIEDSDSEALAEVDSVEKTFAKTNQYFKSNPKVKIAMISGKMDQSVVNEEIGKFSRGEYDILISTTIIEVGVNVPNASVMLIKNSERFGLSQLHQLRGRVGRGIYQSHCILLSQKKDNEKLTAMCETTDGFKIAETDLRLRGTGDFVGTKQSGENKYVMLMMASSPAYFEEIRNLAKEMYADKEKRKRYAILLEKDISDK